MIPFNRDLDVEYGRCDRLSPLIRRVVAENPGPFTFRGTGTYIVGTGEVAVIDPGPLDEVHLTALEAALDGETVTHILVTHTHSDHSPGAGPLQERTKAPTYAFGPHPPEDDPVSAIVEPESAPDGGEGEGGEPKGEGHDRQFSPDVPVRDGDIISGSGWTIECVHTPGHISNHICYALAEERVLFSGDHVMGWSTSVVSPPAGDMLAYMNSLDKVLARGDATYWPTHGPAITDPDTYVRALIEHRRDRERDILGRVAAGDRHIPEIVTALYIGLDEKLVKAAGRSVLAHLRQLVAENRVAWDGAGDAPGIDNEYRLTA
jgi:glyoxylase-like metal-dependent hydrolase (beta-lactamase superfamily II)